MADEIDSRSSCPSPWISPSSGKVANPWAPAGGCGPGGSAVPRPLGTEGNSSGIRPHPNSPVARNLVMSEIDEIVLEAGRVGGRIQLPPLLHVTKFSGVYKAHLGHWEYDETRQVHDFNFIDLVAHASLQIPPKAKKRGKVMVGFIQNVLSRDMKAEYTKQGTVPWSSGQGQWLDTGYEDSSHWPWYGEPGKPFWKSVDYKGGVKIDVAYDDWPGGHYWNYFGEKEDDGELLSLTESMDVVLWLAARMEDDDPTDLNAYSILLARHVTYDATLKIAKTASQCLAEDRKKGLEYRTLLHYKPIYDSKNSNTAWTAKSAEGKVPVLVGPRVQDVLGPLVPKTVVAPEEF